MKSFAFFRHSRSIIRFRRIDALFHKGSITTDLWGVDGDEHLHGMDHWNAE
jgi:hypothetical protein